MRSLIASNNEGISQRIQAALLAAGHECHSVPATPVDFVCARAAKLQPDLVIAVVSPEPEPGLDLITHLRPSSHARILAVGSFDSKLRLRALRAGADHYLDEEQFEAELELILSRHASAEKRSALPEPVEDGQLISVLAPSGGSGASTLAVNLAALWAKDHKRCALLDLRLGGGDLAALLDVKPAHTLADLCKNSPRMDRVMFELSLVRHDSGVHLLAPPRAFSDIGLVTTQGVRQALALARTMFPYVVVDLDDSFHPEQMQTVQQSDLVLLVLRLDFTSLRNTRRTLDHLEQVGVSRDRVRIIVNRSGQPEELPASKVEQALGAKVFHYVPDDPKTINRANNNGRPAVLESPSAKFSKSLAQLAASVNGKKAP